MIGPTNVNDVIDGLKLTKAEEIAQWHEAQRDYHMVLARGFRHDLDLLDIDDPDEAARWDQDATIGEQVIAARWHNRAAWLTRWHERMTPRQATLL